MVSYSEKAAVHPHLPYGTISTHVVISPHNVESSEDQKSLEPLLLASAYLPIVADGESFNPLRVSCVLFSVAIVGPCGTTLSCTVAGTSKQWEESEEAGYKVPRPETFIRHNTALRCFATYGRTKRVIHIRI